MKGTLLLVCVLAVCNLMLFAQDGKGPRMVHTKEKSAVPVPAPEFPATLTRIYSNLGTKTDLYYVGSGVGHQRTKQPLPYAIFRAAFYPEV
ncbi:MAG TPA: hypothetical protein VKQ11_19620 [Candidatus Sulfotelmatobacter sp.]|nr:hypothetical protein [Candidatus Sulfotelmatobacter sp.]